MRKTFIFLSAMCFCAFIITPVQMPIAAQNQSGFHRSVSAQSHDIWVRITSGQETWGTASFSDGERMSTVFPGQETTIVAYPNAGYAFDEWDDGVTDNPRTIIAANAWETEYYTAIFREVSSAALSTESVTFAEQGYANGTAVGSYEGQNFSVEFVGSAGLSPTYYENGAAIRLYMGSSMTVSANSGTILQIAFSFGSGDGGGEMSVNTGRYDSISTWSGSASSVQFSVSRTQRRIAGMTVTLEGASPVPTSLDTVTCAVADSIATTLSMDSRTSNKYVMIGYVTSIDASSSTTATFWIDDNVGSHKTIFLDNVTVPSGFEVGAKVAVTAYIGRYTGMKGSMYEGQTLSKAVSPSVEIKQAAEKENCTIRLNPYSLDWENAYVYIWKGSSSYSSSGALVAGKQMTLAEDGWWTYMFERTVGTSFHVGFDYQSDNSPYYSLSSTSFSESTCLEYNSGLKAVDCGSLIPDEGNSFTVNVTTAGTFGQLMVQQLGDLTWTDVAALTVTGTLNDDDMQYFARMTNLQQLDLSGTNITGIGGMKDMARLSSVSLPSSCIALKDNAFQNCKRLVSINLDNVQTVGDHALSGCVALTTLNMPAALTIAADAFNGDTKITSANLPLATSIGTYAFANCSTLVQVDISDVKSLGTYAFRNDVLLEQVTLSDDLEVIPNYCFQACAKLIALALPAALKEIGTSALPAVTNMRLPEGLTKVASGNFSNAASVNIPSTITTWSSFSDSWRNVYCDVIVPPAISVFNTDNVSNDTLHVPVISLAAYKLHTNWYKFGKIVATDGDVENLNINGEFSLLTTDGVADKVNITLSSGGKLIVSSENEVTVGNYVQKIASPELSYSGTLLVNSPVNADNVTVQFVPKPNKWNFFSLPFDVNMEDITIQTEGVGTIGTSQWVIREYSGANRASGNGNTWNNVPANGVLKAHTGYILYWVVENSGSYLNNSSSSSVTLLYYFNMPAAKNSSMQQIFAANDVNVPLTEYPAEFPQNVSWNLVGNPYPCLFNIQQMDFNAPITVWNGSGYTAYSIVDDSYSLNPAQAFFVQAPENTEFITFHKDGRANKSSAPKRFAANSTRKVFNFVLANDDYSDRARLVLNDNASAEYDLTCDASKMMASNQTVPQLYISDNGIRYAIDERPEQGNCILGAYFGKEGEYTFRLSVPANEFRQVVVTDKETGISTDLSLNEYTFTTSAGNFEDRFIVSFINRVPSNAETIQSPNTPIKTMENGCLIITTPQGKKYTVGGIEL